MTLAGGALAGVPLVSTDRRSFREIARSGEVSLYELHVAYWSGDFEKGGESCVFVWLVRGETPRPAPRELVSRVVGWGFDWIPDDVESRDGLAQWEAMARVDEQVFYKFGESWLRTFRRFEISDIDFQTWVSNTKSDPIRRRIERVLTRAANIARKHPQWRYRKIADALMSADGRYAEYGFDSIRKILSGTFKPAIRRRIPGLRDWMQR